MLIKMRNLIRALKIISYIIWLSVTLLGTTAFYNLTTIQTDFETTTQGYDKVIITVSVSYRGYLYDLEVCINFTLYDDLGNIISRNGTVIYLRPGGSTSSTVVLHVTPDVASGMLSIFLAQIIFGHEFIGFRIQEPIEVGGGS